MLVQGIPPSHVRVPLVFVFRVKSRPFGNSSVEASNYFVVSPGSIAGTVTFVGAVFSSKGLVVASQFTVPQRFQHFQTKSSILKRFIDLFVYQRRCQSQKTITGLTKPLVLETKKTTTGLTKETNLFSRTQFTSVLTTSTANQPFIFTFRYHGNVHKFNFFFCHTTHCETVHAIFGSKTPVAVFGVKAMFFF